MPTESERWKVKEKIIWKKRDKRHNFSPISPILKSVNHESWTNKELQVKMAKLSELAISSWPINLGFKDIKSIFRTDYC